MTIYLYKNKGKEKEFDSEIKNIKGNNLPKGSSFETILNSSLINLAKVNLFVAFKTE